MPRVRNNQKMKANPARPQGHIGLEATLWATAEQAVPAPTGGARLRRAVILNRGRAPALVLGLIFLKYISDDFAEKHAALLAPYKGRAFETLLSAKCPHLL